MMEPRNINLLTKENIEKLTTNEWLDLLSNELSGQYSTKQYKLNPQILYRGRINWDYGNQKRIDSFSHTNDLWAPPAKYVIKDGRCNLKGQSILYCSKLPLAPFFELPVQPNQEITIIAYKVKQDIELVSIVGVKILQKVKKEWNRIFENHFKNSNPNTEILDDQLSLLFRQRASEINSYHIYNITNAVAKLFLYNTDSRRGWGDRGHRPSIGIVYPSVETIAPAMNFALKPEKVKDILTPIKAWKYKVLEKVSETELKIQLTHESNWVYSNGEIRWRSNLLDSRILSAKEFYNI